MKLRLGAALFALSLAGSALAFGAQNAPVLVIVAMASAAAAWLLPLARTPRSVWLLVALAGYALVQVAPLPLGVVNLLSPSAAAVWRGAFTPFGEAAPRFASLSVDPAATTLEVLKWGSYACVLSAAFGLRARRGSETIALVVAGSALVVALVTFVHGLFDLPLTYGLYRATDLSRWLRGPFVNGNNLSGYLNLGTFAAAGLWVTQRGARTRLLLGAAMLTTATGSLLAGSRAGTATLLFGIPAFAWLALRPGPKDRLRIGLGVATITLAGIAVAGMLGGARIWTTFADTQVRAKVSAWRWTLDMIRDFPVFGVGRGAFETAFEPYRQPLGNDWTQVFAHAESFPLEWAAEWGLPIAVLALGMVAITFRRLVRDTERSPIAAGLTVGLGVLALQNLADLALEIHAVTALALAAFAGAKRPHELTERTWQWTPALAPVALGTALVVITSAAPVQVERRRAALAYRAVPRGSAQGLRAFQANLEPFVRRHPAEAYFPLLGGHAALRLGQNPLPWLGRALQRSPLDGNVHLALADAFAARKTYDQALLHARLAAVYDQTLRVAAMRRIAERAHTAEDLRRAFPVGLPGAQLLVEQCAAVRSELVIPCFREAAARDHSVEAERGLAAALVQALEAGAVPCVAEAARSCAEEASAALDRVERDARGNGWQTATIRARLMASVGDPRRAALTLLERCPATSEAAECCARALDLAAVSRDLPAMTTAASRYAAIACSESSACAAAHEHIGRLYEQLGAHAYALRHFTDAADRSPTTERWLLAAEAAAGAGSKVAARLALKRATEEGVNAPGEHDRVTALEARLAAGGLE